MVDCVRLVQPFGVQAMHPTLRRIVAITLLALSGLGVYSLSTKEIPLVLFGQSGTGIVNQVEVITHSGKSRWTGNDRRDSGYSHTTILHLTVTTKDGKKTETKTHATFNTETRVGDEHPVIYLPSNPTVAKIYNARQFWLPLCVAVTFTTLCFLGGARLLQRPRPKQHSRIL